MKGQATDNRSKMSGSCAFWEALSFDWWEDKVLHKLCTESHTASVQISSLCEEGWGNMYSMRSHSFR